MDDIKDLPGLKCFVCQLFQGNCRMTGGTSLALISRACLGCKKVNPPKLMDLMFPKKKKLVIARRRI